MRGFVFPATIAAVLATLPFAFATELATGAVKSFDANAHMLTLEDGIAYNLPITFKDPGFKPGTKVSVAWEMKNGRRVADNVKIEELVGDFDDDASQTDDLAVPFEDAHEKY